MTGRDTSPRDEPAGVLVVCDDGDAAARVACALGDTELVVRWGTEVRDGEVVVLAGAGDAEELLARITEIARAQPPAWLVACVPAATPSSLLRKALRAGARGIVFDERLEATLDATVAAVTAGQLAMPPELRRHVAPFALSHRERQVLALVAGGLTNRQIAARLYLAESTIKTHLCSAFEKLDVRSRAEATAVILEGDEGPAMGLVALLGGTEDLVSTGR